MRVALVHDALVNRGGAERVAAVLCEAFPGAPLYTSVYLPHLTYEAFRSVDIRPLRGLERVLSNERRLKMALPLVLWRMARQVIRGYDVVLSSSTFAAKFVGVEPPGVHVCYCYTPFRLAWDPASYGRDSDSWLRRATLRLAASVLRPVDRWAADRVDHFVTMTELTRKRIRVHYGREAQVVRPPIDCAAYQPHAEKGEDFLFVSRLEPYKRGDLVIDAFNLLRLPLLVVGHGSEAHRLRARALPNIHFRGTVTDAELRGLYARARAVIFPQKEDFGLVPLEAIASGTPVIAYGAGGILETMIPAMSSADAHRSTAVFFHEQSSKALLAAVEQFNGYTFDPEFLQHHALQFDTSAFVAAIHEILARAAARGTAPGDH